KGKHFRNDGLQDGVALSGNGLNQGAMGVDFGDYNRDGLLDLFVTTFESEPDSLYTNQPSQIFTFDSLKTNIGPPTSTLVGFGSKFADFNNAGWLDLVIANGHIHDNEEQIDQIAHYKQPMVLLMQANGVFVDRSLEAGIGFLKPAAGRGLAIGD